MISFAIERILMSSSENPLNAIGLKGEKMEGWLGTRVGVEVVEIGTGFVMLLRPCV